MSDLDLFAEFCGQLVLENGFRMEVEPFQRTILTEYFDGCLETLVLLPKKSGKTSLIAALSLYHVLVTSDAECVIGASSRDQATILFNQARGLVERSPEFLDHFAVKTGFREIRAAHDNGRIRVLAADAGTADGVIPTLAIVDELHRHKNADLYGVFRDGLGPRHGQIITISTAGSDEETPLGAMRKRAYKLPGFRRSGRAYRHVRTPNGQFVLHEWALDAKDDTDDIDLVKQANPSSWQTVEQLRARHDSPTTMTWQWLRFACGIWVRGFETWIPRWRWDECANDTGPIPDGTDVVIAFDGSYNGDTTGLVACTVPVIEEAADASEDDLPSYAGSPPHLMVVDAWERPDDADDDWTVPVLDVEKAIRRACRRWRVREITCDSHRWQRSLEILAAERRPVVDYPQSPSRMIPATTRLTTGIMNGSVTHDGDERLARHVENAVLKVSDAGGQLAKPSKTGPLRIDLAVCAVMAFDRAHFYKPRGSLVVDPNELWEEMQADGESIDPFAPDVPTIKPPEHGTADLLVDSDDPLDLEEFLSGRPASVVKNADGVGFREVDGYLVVRVLDGSPKAFAEFIERDGGLKVWGALATTQA